MLDWEVEQVRDGQYTCKLNGKYIYSKYDPYKSAEKWIKSEVDQKYSAYFLIGLGLGYHLKALIDMKLDKPIIVYFFDSKEFEMFSIFNKEHWWKTPSVKIAHNLEDVHLNENIQILIPHVVLKALGTEHTLYNVIEVIKINTISYKKQALQMKENFEQNIQDANYLQTININKKEKVACLVAAGPSLNETVKWLKEYADSVDIYVVGAALKVLLDNGIEPTAVVLSDAKDEVMSQFVDTDFKGKLYYLCTANYQAVRLHKGEKNILFQNGYKKAEKYALSSNLPLVETGGSVGTTTFSLIELLGYKNVILFGQDLGYVDEDTHANGSTSGGKIQSAELLRTIEANNGEQIHTNAMLQTFLYWYNNKMKTTKMKVYNTALRGAKIVDVPYINFEEFVEIVKARE